MHDHIARALDGNDTGGCKIDVVEHLQRDVTHLASVFHPLPGLHRSDAIGRGEDRHRLRRHLAWLNLAPVVAEEQPVKSEIDRLVSSHPLIALVVDVGNVSHRRLRQRLQPVLRQLCKPPGVDDGDALGGGAHTALGRVRLERDVHALNVQLLGDHGRCNQRIMRIDGAHHIWRNRVFRHGGERRTRGQACTL